MRTLAGRLFSLVLAVFALSCVAFLLLGIWNVLFWPPDTWRRPLRAHLLVREHHMNRSASASGDAAENWLEETRTAWAARSECQRGSVDTIFLFHSAPSAWQNRAALRNTLLSEWARLHVMQALYGASTAGHVYEHQIPRFMCSAFQFPKAPTTAKCSGGAFRAFSVTIDVNDTDRACLTSCLAHPNLTTRLDLRPYLIVRRICDIGSSRDREFFKWTGVFLIGLEEPGDPEGTTDAWTDLEAVAVGDMVRLNKSDDYVALTTKFLAGLRWVTLHCPHLHYVVKADDDVAVEPVLFRRYLDDQVGLTKRVIYCSNQHHNRVVRHRLSPRHEHPLQEGDNS
ncbi:hypothetical protein HPB50_012602 [Hyalomma asiaticum]|uniref:Uncharacterized protein n=1 Tax=Hyalomma asiaticum TaxID=266040 RepID=A0ACB7S2D9_HYAAI|nr:hypothetical protein HPB50_012602 [Hyalomma asiaticum]